ncbi:KH domain-containing protein [Sporolactobacillus shoreicorticis]|uniref:RNA-binding protein KhpA n=1 Tax=Sporolactobacillus shoreicorticis TaxID=1923877 RepID=A0ABW5S5K8_9BACL|nr:KH domain-containing protein [Sporolactobacillus shoreicorticis]MCO7127960.1 KH domain-containing protein [Sporolactobacillus shoreicorticis]
MEELIKTIVLPLVDDHMHVMIEKQEESDHVTYILSVDKKDMGKVIGRHGQVAEAVRTVVSAVGSANGVLTRFLIRE